MNSPQRDIVLIVDDSPDTLRMLTDAIEDAGKTVLVARQGLQALDMVAKITPDIILLDAVMPGMDGFETCRSLKRHHSAAHVPIIFMTGLTDTVDIVKGLEAGGVDYVTKPIVPEEILARIHVHLINARMTHHARTALDVFGRHLLAVRGDGRVLWCTPQASRLLAAALHDFSDDGYALPSALRTWLESCATGKAGADSFALSHQGPPVPLNARFIGEIGSNEFLLRIEEAGGPDEQGLLQRKLGLTVREAEVLTWIARGKSNRDIAEILTLSPRTVNKHLEQIYTKLGVENRTSAAAIAVRMLSAR